MSLQLGNSFDIIQPMVVLPVQVVLTQEIQCERSQDMISITMALIWIGPLSFGGKSQSLSQVKLHSTSVGAYLDAFFCHLMSMIS